MKFAQWLESQDNTNISFVSFFNDGTVTVYVGNTKYVYITDAVYHDKWLRNLQWIKRTKPVAYRKVAFGILSKIKKMVEMGSATQIEPKRKEVQKEIPPVHQPTTERPKPIQKTLF